MDVLNSCQIDIILKILLFSKPNKSSEVMTFELSEKSFYLL